MNIDKPLKCPDCNSSHFKIRREAAYLYTYTLDTLNEKDESESDESLPFLFDNREKIDSREYLECENCGAKFPCHLDELNNKIHLTIVQKALRSDYASDAHFLG